METDTLPPVRDLESFAEKLPKENRAELYRIVRAFYHIGSGDGAMISALAISGATLRQDTSALYRNYFSRKMLEAEKARKFIK